MCLQIAIDGPAGSGKSTISKRLAEELGFIHIDTGAMYRAVTLEALTRNIDLYDEKAYSFLANTKIHYENDAIFLNNINVSTEIRSYKVTKEVSLVSSHAYVRKTMVDLQRRAVTGNVVMDGRDIGSHVLPNAQIKIYLTANVEERARRRYAELAEAGFNPKFNDVKKEIITRDETDSKRTESPLVIAKDALVIDTTYLTIEEVIKIIKNKINKFKLGE